MTEEMLKARLGQIEVAFAKRSEPGYEMLYQDLLRNLLMQLEKENKEKSK